MRKAILFVQWFRTLLNFYVFRKYRNWDWERIAFIEKSYEPKNKRDKRLFTKIVEYNKRK